MAITELVLLISKVLEAARTIWNKIQHMDVVIADKTDNVSHIVADTLTRKAELQRKIDEKTDYIDRLKIGLSNMVRNYGFENMNEFYLSYKESKTAFADYQQKAEDWKKGYDNVVVSKDKTETMSEKLDRMQNEVESSRQYNKQNQMGEINSSVFPIIWITMFFYLCLQIC